MRSALVRASRLPERFALPSLWGPIRGCAARVGRFVRITLHDQEHGGTTVLTLRLTQRVRILRGAS